MNSAALGAFTLLAVLATKLATLPDRAEFAIHPSDSDLALFPGEQATVTLYVEAAAALEVPHLELAPSAVDWRVEADGVVHYLEAGTCINSASAWVYTTPSAISLVPGGAGRIRVTVKVPRNAEPGVYRTGVRIAHNRDARTIGLSGDVLRLTVRIVPPVSLPRWQAAP